MQFVRSDNKFHAKQFLRAINIHSHYITVNATELLRVSHLMVNSLPGKSEQKLYSSLIW